MNKKIKTFVIISAVFSVFSCSSAPKKPAEVYVIRRHAEQELDLGNKAASQGNFDIALQLLTEAKRKSVSVDDSSLIIRTALARGNVLLSADRVNDAFAEWDDAIKEAQRSKNTELLSVSYIFKAKGSLLSGRDTDKNVLDTITREHSNIKNRFYLAFSWQARGLALRSLKSYNEAENAVMQSLAINLKDLYLENASYDWYIIASVRSLAGNYNGAVQALEESMKIDRRIENSRGLSTSWKAMGDVYSRMGREQDAKAAYERAEAILKAVN